MTNQEIIEVVSHHSRGGRIQEHDGKYLDINYPPVWNFQDNDYRIHPEEQAIIDHWKGGGDLEVRTKNTYEWFDVNYHRDSKMNWKEKIYRIKPKEDKKLGDDLQVYDEKNPEHAMVELKKIKLPEKWHHVDLDRSEQKDNEIIYCLHQIIDRVKL